LAVKIIAVLNTAGLQGKLFHFNPTYAGVCAKKCSGR